MMRWAGSELGHLNGQLDGTIGELLLGGDMTGFSCFKFGFFNGIHLDKGVKAALIAPEGLNVKPLN